MDDKQRQMTSLAAKLIEEEEGRRAQPYYDSLGYVTVGVGHLCDPRRPCPMPEHVIDALLDHDLAEARESASHLPGWSRLNEVQQAVLVSMVFQIGVAGVRGFRKMLEALAAGDFRAAAREGRDSKWARADTPRRAERQMRMLETGLWVPKGSV